MVGVVDTVMKKREEGRERILNILPKARDGSGPYT